MSRNLKGNLYMYKVKKMSWIVCMYEPKSNDILCIIEDIVIIKFMKDQLFYESYFGMEKKK